MEQLMLEGVDDKLIDVTPLTLHEWLADADSRLVSLYDERTDGGITWLDANKPGWLESIRERMDELDLSSNKLCVLGLTFGDYWKAAEPNWDDLPGRIAARLARENPLLTEEEAIALGFTTPHHRVWSFKIEQMLGTDHVDQRDRKLAMLNDD
jgi:hypothetical protein